MFVPKGICPAVLALAVGFGSAAAFADDSTTQQMQQQIAQLEAKVEKLEAQQTQPQNQNPSQNESATMNAIAADANSQSQFLAPVISASGYDSATGFHLASDDGNFFLHPWLLFQFRGDINGRISPDGSPSAVPATGSTEADGFEIHNLMFGLNGHLFTPNLQYYFMVDAPSSAAGTDTLGPLQDAYATYRLGDDCPFVIKAGQFVDPVWHESNVDDGHLLLVDRSLAGVLLGGNTGLNNIAERVQGAGVGYTTEAMRGEFDLTDGYGTANTPFYNVPGSTVGSPDDTPVNFGMSGRFEYKIIGDDNAWKEYDSLGAKDVKSDSLVAGAGAEWTEADVFDNIYLTADAQYTNPSGLNVYGAVLLNEADWSSSHPTAAQADLVGSYTNVGFIAQSGFMVTPNIEPFARYDLALLTPHYADILAYGTAHPVGESASDDNHELTVGVNYYLYDYRAKVTGDISFLPNGSAIDASGLGILADENHSEWVGRVQFQLSI